MAKKYRRPYPTVQAWQAATGTTNRQLAKLVGCHESHICNILKKSRRCSLPIAFKLSRITNVSIESIAAWPPEYEEAV